MRTLLNRKFVLRTLVLAAFLAAAVFSAPQFAEAKNGSGRTVVVLTASWCGSCREILPAVQSAAASVGGVRVVTLDVDSNSAPTEASNYGISVAGDVPQVYLVNNGRTVLLFTGRGYHMGNSQQARQQIEQQLRNNL
jgi:thiol-disulfide isomerase/thioredoxin